jgi:uncharacterized protein (TIGR02246 family)
MFAGSEVSAVAHDFSLHLKRNFNLSLSARAKGGQIMITMAPTHSAITQANQAFMKAFNEGDAAAVSHCYAEDGQILPPQSEPITGRAGIEAFWRAVMDMGIQSATLETAEVGEHPDGAYEIGRYLLATASGQPVDRGKYLVIWREEDGALKLYRDIWNTSLAPSA